MVLSVCRERSSPEAMAKQLLSTKIWDPAQLGDWLRTEWGPGDERRRDALSEARGPWPSGGALRPSGGVGAAGFIKMGNSRRRRHKQPAG